MTNEELQAHIGALQSAIDQGLIEEWADFESPCRPARTWLPLHGGTIVIGNPLLKMRIKKHPREIFAIYRDGMFVSAGPNPFGGSNVETVKFREVIE